MNNSNFKIGILTTIEEPLLPFYISALSAQGLKDLAIICDSKTASKKDKKIWIERTNGIFEKDNNGLQNIYRFSSLIPPFYFVDSHNGKPTIELIRKHKIKCLLNAGTPRKLSINVLQSTQHGVVNIHPGVLPSYRGCSAVEWAIFNDDKVGNTAHFMTEDYDEGPIISTECYDFQKDTDYVSIRVKVHQEGCLLAGRALKVIKKTLMKPSDGIAQDKSKAQYWDPIPDKKFKAVLSKLLKQEYRYQIL